MTAAELSELKLCLTCGSNSLGAKLLKGLSQGHCVDELVDSIKVVHYLLDTVCRYDATDGADNALTETQLCAVIDKIKTLIK